jgi:hypothetical protein
MSHIRPANESVIGKSLWIQGASRVSNCQARPSADDHTSRGGAS